MAKTGELSHYPGIAAWHFNYSVRAAASRKLGGFLSPVLVSENGHNI